MQDETVVPEVPASESGQKAADAAVSAAVNTDATAAGATIKRKRHPALRFLRLTILPLITLFIAAPIMLHAWREYAMADLEQTIANGGGHFVLPPLRPGSATPSLTQQFREMWVIPADKYDGVHVNLRESLLTPSVVQKLQLVCSSSKPGNCILVLDKGVIDPPTAASIRTLPAKFNLVLTRLEISDTAWNELRALKSVESLTIDSTCLTPSGIDAIVSFPELKSITVMIEDDSANAALAKAASKMPKIETFEIRTRLPYRLSPEDRASFGQLPNGAEFIENVWPAKGKGIMDYL